jgi:hypothetical protein
MRCPSPIYEKTRFSGQLRHYHRSGASARRSWEQWVDGEDAKPGNWRKWLMVAGAVLLLLALGAIITGLVLALR